MTGRSSAPVALSLAAVLLISSLIVFHRLGDASLQGDESIYALASRESVERGVWWPLYLPPGQLFHTKPPAKPVIVAACFKALGESELAARLPDAVFGVLTIALVFLVGARKFGLGAGLLSSTVILAAEGYLCIHGVRDSVMDSLLTLLAIVICLAWLNVRNGRPRKWFWWSTTAAAVVLAGLSKNVFGVAFAAVLVVIELSAPIWERRRSPVLLPVVGIAATAVFAALAYFTLMLWVSKGAYASFQYEDLVVRATRGISQGHLHGPLFYPQTLIGDFGPWLLLVLVTAFVVVRGRPGEGRRDAVFLLVFAAVFIGMFSLSNSKLPWYLYPAYPALALVIGYGAREFVRAFPSVMWRGTTMMVILGLVVIDLSSLWTRVQGDVQVIDAERFVWAYSQLEDVSLIIDAPSIRKHGRFRDWNRFYLKGAPNVQCFSRPPVKVESGGRSCTFLATGEPGSYPPTRAQPWRPIMKLRKLDGMAGDIWILGTCDLEVPGTIGADSFSWDDLIIAEGFEGGDADDLDIETTTNNQSMPDLE